MKIIMEKSKYHRFALYYDYRQDRVDVCKQLKETFGFKEFSFAVDGDMKRWVFTNSIIIPVLKAHFPEIVIEPSVQKIVENEQAWSIQQTEKGSIIDEIKLKKDTDFKVQGIKKQLYPYQKVGVEFLESSGGKAIIADAPGCISGDSKIIVNRSKGARTYTMRELYQKQNNTFKKHIPSKTRSLSSNGYFYLNTIKSVLYMGEKETLTIVAKNDENKKYSITLTPDHRVSTPNGWVEAQNLVKGDYITTNGEKLKYCNICKNDTPHALSDYTKNYKPKNYNKCKKCIYRFFRKNSTKGNEYVNQDGYVYVSNAFFHPLGTKRKLLLKHVLVYEAYKNDVSYSEWLEMCSKNNIPAGSYFVDSKKYAVHHKDGDRQNNTIGNLEIATHSEHAKIHGYEKRLHFKNCFVPGNSKIISIKKNKKKIDVYDIVMSGTDRNFITNGVVVHNCGKTAQALAYCSHKGFKRVLAVSPASVKFAWANEVRKWTNLSSIVIDSKTDLSKIDPKINVWIINYDILKKHYPVLTKVRFDCIVGDECHLVKSTTAMRTKAFRAISRDIPSVILLSGTPLLSRPSELFSLLNIIDPSTWNNWYDFARKYCDAHQTRWGLDTSGVSNSADLHNRIKRYFIRRDKSDVLKDLPAKTFINLPVQLQHSVKKEYDAAANNLAQYLRQYQGKQSADIAKALEAEKLAQLNVLRQLSSKGKIDTAIELAENIIESGEKVLIFCSFIDPLEQIKMHFKNKAVMITGKTPVDERGQVVETFQNDKSVSVFLGGIKSAGVGITLTAASNVIFLDYSWNPADMQQAQDRVHRIGQVASSVNIYQLEALDTIDEDLKSLLEHKQDIFNQIIEGHVADSIAKDAVQLATQRILKDY